jgi:hypothetical protein
MGCPRPIDYGSMGPASKKAGPWRTLVGTVFQLPNPDAIYSRDKEKERKVGRHLMFVVAHGPHAAEAR